MPSRPTSRTEWLKRALPRLRRLLPARARPVRLKVGITGRPRRRARSILGVTELPGDRLAYIEVSSSITSGRLALAVLLHELVHAAAPRLANDHGHEFRRLARAVGFVSPYRLIHLSPQLSARLRSLSRELGPYPSEP